MFREDIDIPDTMNASILFENGVQASYSLNASMPIEGYHLAFNGTKGRIEVRQYEAQPWVEPPADEILLVRSFGVGVERIWVPRQPGGHFGGDDRLRNGCCSAKAWRTRLGQRAGAEAGAMSAAMRRRRRHQHAREAARHHPQPARLSGRPGLRGTAGLAREPACPPPLDLHSPQAARNWQV